MIQELWLLKGDCKNVIQKMIGTSDWNKWLKQMIEKMMETSD